MNNPNNYTAEDIARYHRGEMTPAERHGLEAAALDNSMLADALEGYRFTSTASSDLDSLQARLKLRLKQKEEHKSLFFNRTWARIAALFIVIAGAGWLVLQQFSGSQNNLAQTNGETTKEENSNNAISTDTTSPLFRNSPPALENEGFPTANDIAVFQKKQTQNPPNSGEKKADPEGRINEPFETAQVATNKEVNNTKETSAAPQKEEAQLLREAPAAASRMRMDTATQLNDTLSKQRRFKNSSDQRDRTNEAIKKENNAVPVNGWPAFYAYLRQAQQDIEGWNKKDSLPTAVELEFRVDERGRPQNFQVLESVCKACDEEAIRLLKNGPDWKGNKGRVFITLIKK